MAVLNPCQVILTSLSVLALVDCLLSPVEIFLVLCVMSDFPLKSGHSECYVMRYCILFKPWV